MVFRFSESRLFPEGTTIGAYPAASENPGSSPMSDVIETAVMLANGTAEFSGLLPATWYVAYASVGGDHRYTTFRTDPLPDGSTLRSFVGPEEEVQPLIDALPSGVYWTWAKTFVDGELDDIYTGVTA